MSQEDYLHVFKYHPMLRERPRVRSSAMQGVDQGDEYCLEYDGKDKILLQSPKFKELNIGYRDLEKLYKHMISMACEGFLQEVSQEEK